MWVDYLVWFDVIRFDLFWFGLIWVVWVVDNGIYLEVLRYMIFCSFKVGDLIIFLRLMCLYKEYVGIYLFVCI